MKLDIHSTKECKQFKLEHPMRRPFCYRFKAAASDHVRRLLAKTYGRIYTYIITDVLEFVVRITISF